MLPTSLLMELYDQQISQAEFEQMLVAPESSNDYDPYMPMSRVPHHHNLASFCKINSRHVNTTSSSHYEAGSISSTRSSSRSISPMSSTSLSSSLREENISYWQDLEVYSPPSSDDRRSSDLDNKSTTQRSTNIRNKHGFRLKFCSFCFNNQESEPMYTSHDLRDNAKNITCPILFDIVCSTCGATGTDAHTPKYCSKKPLY